MNFNSLSKRRVLTAVFLVTSLVILLSLTGSLLLRKEKKEKPKSVSQIASLATAYGSQRHVFGGSIRGTSQQEQPLVFEKERNVAGVQKIFGGSLVAIWLKDNQIHASFSNNYGQSWQELSSPLTTEKVEVVAGAQDQEGNLHLVYESEGKIFYRKISEIVSEGLIKPDGWTVSSSIALDISGLAHRPSLILDFFTNLPVVAWSSESMRAGARFTRINFLRAKAEPTLLGNWCNAQGTSCGTPAYVLDSGSADSLGAIAFHAVLHSALGQMPLSGDLYLWWSEASKVEPLKLAVAKREGNNWVWGNVSIEDQLDAETFRNFSLAAAADLVKQQVLIVYAQAGGKTKVVAYKKDGSKEDLSPDQKLGGQFSLAAHEGKYYLFYRKDNGKVAGRLFDTSWSEELFESPGEGGYPSVTADAIDGKIIIAYTTPEGAVGFLSYDLAPVPTPTPTASPSATLAPTATPTGTESATPTP